MIPLLFKLSGVAGLLLITGGIWIKNAVRRDWIFALGGLGLLAYSAYLRDQIFIVLQIVFIASNLLELYRKRQKFKI